MTDRSDDESTPLDLQESVAAPATVQKDGTVLMQLIRPCVGRGKGRHVYEAKMLREHAGVFTNWKMYVDHDTDAERKSRGGLPRSVKDLGGIVTESYWDESVPAEGRFGQGAVMGKVRAIDAVAELVKLHPSLVESSINARATGVQPVERDGKRAWLVEGIEPTGTVDWVTEGGAGGKVVSLLEAAVSGTPEEQEAALFESMTDEELVEQIKTTRPGVLALVEAAMPPQFKKKSGGEGDGDPEDVQDKGADEDYEKLVEKYTKSGMSPEMAARAAKAKLAGKPQEAAEQGGDPPTPPATPNEGGAVTQVTAEDIKEAIVTDPEIGQVIRDLVEAGIGEARAQIENTARAQAYADTDRLIEVRDLRDTAHTLIREAKLPVEFEKRALAEFDIVEGAPTAALDQFEDVDEESGEVTKTADAALREAVEHVISEQRTLVASLKPTRVVGQGPGSKPAGDGEAGSQKADKVGPLTRSMLLEAGFTDPDKVYAPVGD